MGTKQEERQLCKNIDRRIDRMNKALQLCTPKRSKHCITEEQQIERRISDVGFRNDLMDLINELIEMRKLSERLKDEEQIDRPYIIRLEVSADRLRQTQQGY
ncbi:MAG: hypothetical protein ACREBW_02650, partial [Candidatus Micrarchaeaceae archaeon]